jgi:hypothetical protein
MTRVDHDHHAAQTAQDARSADERAADAHTGQVHASHVSMQRTQLRATIQHRKAQIAAFYRSKRFATSHHAPTSPAGQKLVRQLGQRPRPTSSAKERGKNVAERERHELHQPAAPDKEHGPKHEEKHDGKQEGKHEEKHQQKQDQGQGKHEQKHQQEQEQGQGKHEQKQKQEQEQGQGQQGQGQSQQQQPQQRDSQNRERNGKPAAAVLKGAKAAPPAPPGGMQAIAAQRGDSPDLPRALAAAYTKAILQLSSKLEFGPLLAPLLALSSTSPAVLKRSPARLQAQRNGAFAQRRAAGEKPTATAATTEMIGHSLDLTLARQRFGILYQDHEQSLSAVKQRLLDAAASLPAPAAQGAPANSRKSHEVRIAPAAPATKP